MKYILALILMLSVFMSFGQTKVLQLSKQEGEKVKTISADQRVKVRTVDRKKYVGTLQFEDAETILVGGTPVKVDSILSIKKHPKVLGTVKTVVLVGGLALVGGSVVAATAGSNAAFLLFATGSGVAITAGVLESLNANHSNRKWNFEIIEQ